jgi:hypothetical protein
MSEGTDWDEVLWNLQSFQRNALGMYQESFKMEGVELAKREHELAGMAGGFANSYSLAAVIKLLSDDSFRAKLKDCDD